MRKELGKMENARIRVVAKVEKFGQKSSYKGPPQDTVCLVDIQDEAGKVLCDHLWLTVGKQIAELKLKKGDKITFTARVTKYVKGYFGRREDVYAPPRTDYRLSYPTKFARLASFPEERDPPGFIKKPPNPTDGHNQRVAH